MGHICYKFWQVFENWYKLNHFVLKHETCYFDSFLVEHIPMEKNWFIEIFFSHILTEYSELSFSKKWIF